MHEIAVRAVVGVLEGHLLQQVGHAGGLGGLVNRAGVNKETDARGRTRDVFGGDPDAVGERGDPGGAAAQVVWEGRRQVEAGERVQE